MKNRKIITAALCAMLCLAVLTGCGRSLIITTGFGRGDIFRIGSQSCKISEVRVYMLNLQKENERLFGNAIWESESSADLQEAVREQALAQVTRVKALNQLAVERNVMLTDTETGLAQQAEHDYYAGLSEEEIKYIDLDERNLQRMFCEYALADKTWTSLGEMAEKTSMKRLSATSTQGIGRQSNWKRLKVTFRPPALPPVMKQPSAQVKTRVHRTAPGRQQL